MNTPNIINAMNAIAHAPQKGNLPGLEGSTRGWEISSSQLSMMTIQRTITGYSCLTRNQVERRIRRERTNPYPRPNLATAESTRGKTLVLKQRLAKPPGTAFINAKATRIIAKVGGIDGVLSKVVVDTGSGITLISSRLLNSLKSPPEVRRGEPLALFGVTGNSLVGGYVLIPLLIHTDDGPISMDVEAYVVKGMTSAVILGNDFVDQYRISIVRGDKGTYVHFGNTGRKVAVHNSTTTRPNIARPQSEPSQPGVVSSQHEIVRVERSSREGKDSWKGASGTHIVPAIVLPSSLDILQVGPGRHPKHSPAVTA